MHVDALDPRAGLAGVGEAAPDGAGDRVGQVGVGADDHRVLAAELEHRALEALGADGADLAADLDRAGEEDLADAGAGQRVADRAAAVDDADEALGQAALLEDAADRLAQQRRQAGRLEHDAVAGHQRDRDLAEGDRPGVVPGRDHADDADRLVGEVAFLRHQEGLAHPHLLVGEDLGAGLGAPVQGVDRRQQLHRVGLGARLALLLDQQLGDLVDVVEQGVGGALHVAGAVLQGELGPGGLDAGYVVDHGLDLVRGDRRDRADQLTGGGVEATRGWTGRGGLRCALHGRIVAPTWRSRLRSRCISPSTPNSGSMDLLSACRAATSEIDRAVWAMEREIAVIKREREEFDEFLSAQSDHFQELREGLNRDPKLSFFAPGFGRLEPEGDAITDKAELAEVLLLARSGKRQHRQRSPAQIHLLQKEVGRQGGWLHRAGADDDQAIRSDGAGGPRRT